MHHARQHADTRTRERRHRLAHEAARLMAEGGIRDFHQAKLKAASRLGIHDDASLPRNREIEDALREYQRLFAGPEHGVRLRQRREAALRALDFLSPFQPRLTGPVLDGTADAKAPVQLQLHSDDADAVQRFLEEHRIPAELRTRRLRLDRERSSEFPVWLFSAEDLTFDLTVLPYDALRQAPLSQLTKNRWHAPLQRSCGSCWRTKRFRATCSHCGKQQTAPLHCARTGPALPTALQAATQNAPQCGAFGQTTNSGALSACRRRCSRVCRSRCRSGADGRSSFPGRPAAPANATPSRRCGQWRTSR